MSSTLDEFVQDLFQDIISGSDAEGVYTEDIFFDHYCDVLAEAGEFDHAERAQHWAQKQGIRVDGYGGEPDPDTGILSLIISDFHQVPELATLTASEMESIFKRLTRFLERSLDESWRNALEETSPVFGLADMIAHHWTRITKIRLVLISNRMLSKRVDGREEDQLDGKVISYSVWDIGRLFRFEGSTGGRDDIEIDLENEYGGAIQILRAHSSVEGLESYLTTMPGDVLAKIYDRWGTRLLEQNVRVFLQARGKVNRGIRNTIEGEPLKFFAYNNGLTATAEEILTKTEGNLLLLRKMKNFQIVNGGQTTASIHSAYRNDIDVSKIVVQMKLTTITSDSLGEVVSKISEYANTQNRVNAADFFSNHPFHIRVEEFSRRIFAPSPDGTFHQSKWFYERARGQYADARASQSRAERKKFDTEFPRSQLFSKTDLAKFMNVWNDQPHIVSLGAQKNFIEYAKKIGKMWNNNSDTINEVWYREAVAKAIIFKATEKIVSSQPWYEGGYRANIVAYTIAKLAYDIAKKGRTIDFEAIWQKQALGDGLRAALAMASTQVNLVITETPSGHKNVTEWAKKQACWFMVSKLKIEWPSSLSDELVSTEESLSLRREGRKDQKQLNGIQAQTEVINAGPDVWQEVLDWGGERDLLAPQESRAIQAAINLSRKIPSEKECFAILAALDKLRSAGYQGPPDG